MEVVVFPRIAGVQWSNTVGSTLWGMASGMSVVLDIVLGPMEIAPAFCQPLQVAWSSISGVRASRCRVPWALQVSVLRAPAVARHAADPDPSGQSTGVRTKEVRGLRGGPGPLEGGGPGLQLRVLSIPRGGVRGVAGSFPKQEVGPGPYA